ncbi:hypothetical protein BGX28_008004 [Mortierella sp. GBA30]|nr:hypothetical protein BGX28_008004 [Mortierella sp. GBA30]
MTLPNTPSLLEVDNPRLTQSADSLESALAHFSKLAASIERPGTTPEVSNRGGGFDEWLGGDFHFGSVLSSDESPLAPSPYSASEASPLLEQEIPYSTTSTPSLFENQSDQSESYPHLGWIAQDLGLGPVDVEQATPHGLSTSTLQRAAAALNIPWSQELERAVLAHSRKLSVTVPAISGTLMSGMALQTGGNSGTSTTVTSSTPKTPQKRAHAPVIEESEEVLAKRAKNTDAARRSRLKKLIKLEGLEVKVSDLEVTNNRLNTRIAVLETERNGFLVKEAEQNARIAQLEAKVIEAHLALTTRTS